MAEGGLVFIGGLVSCDNLSTHVCLAVSRDAFSRSHDLGGCVAFCHVM